MAKNKNQTEDLKETIGTEDLPASEHTATPTSETHNAAESDAYDRQLAAAGNRFSDSDFETVVSSAEYWKHEQEPIFIGEYSGRNMIRKEDDPKEPNKKAGDIMGYICTSQDGEEVIIGNSYAITEAFEAEGNPFKAGDIVRVEFLGKSAMSNGQSVNRFKVGVIRKKP